MPPKKDCPACKKVCDRGYFTIGEDHYHPECFKCSMCATGLNGKPYVLHDDGKFYCEEDYAIAIRPKCAHCEETLLGDYITAMDRDWHEDHFLCSDCGASLESAFFVFQAHPYCAPCHAKKLTTACGSCGKPIHEKEMYEAVGHKYHLECFVCQTGLHKIADGESFTLFEDKIYCPKHFMEKMQIRCTICNKEVVGELLSVGDAKMHPACWKCRICHNMLTPETVIVEDSGLFVCKTCDPDGDGSASTLPGHKPLVDATPEEVANWVNSLGLPEHARAGLAGVDGATLGDVPPETLQESMGLEPTPFEKFKNQLDKAKKHGIPLVGYVPLEKATADDVSRWADSIGLPPNTLSGIDGASMASASPEELKSQMDLSPDQQHGFDQNLAIAKRDGIPGGASPNAENQDSNIPLRDATAPEVARWAKSVGVPSPSRFLLAGMDGATLGNLSNEELARQLQLDPTAAQKLSRDLATAKASGLAYQGDVPLEQASTVEVARWADDVGLPDHARSQLAGTDGATLAEADPEELQALLGLDPTSFQVFSKSLDAAKKDGLLTWDAPIPEGPTKPLLEASGPELAWWANSIGVPAHARLPLAGMNGATLVSIPLDKLAEQLKLEPLPAKTFEMQLEQAILLGIPTTETKPLADATALEVTRWLDDTGLPQNSRAQFMGVDGDILSSTSQSDLRLALEFDPATRQAFEKCLDAAKASGIPGKRVPKVVSELRPNFKSLSQAIPAEVSRWANAVGIPDASRLQLAGMTGAALEQISPQDFVRQLNLDPLTAKQVEKSLEVAKKIGFPIPNVKPLNQATFPELVRWFDDLGLDEGLVGMDGATLAAASPAELRAQLKLAPHVEPYFMKGLDAAKATGILANFKGPNVSSPTPTAQGTTPLGKANAAEIAHWARQIGIPDAARARLAGMDGPELARTSADQLAKQLQLNDLSRKNLEKHLSAAIKSGIPALAMKPLLEATPREVSSWGQDIGLANGALVGADGATLFKAANEDLESLQLGPDGLKYFEKSLQAAKASGIPALVNKRTAKPLSDLSGAEVSRWAKEMGVPAPSRLRLEGRKGAALAKEPIDQLKAELQLSKLAAKSFEKNLENAKKYGVQCDATVTPLRSATSAEVANWSEDIGLPSKALVGVDGANLATASLEELKSQLKQLDPREFQSFAKNLGAAKESGILGDGFELEELNAGDGASLKPLASVTAAEVAHWAKSIGMPPAARLQLAGMNGAALSKATPEQLQAQLTLEPRQMAAFLQNLNVVKTIGLITSGTKPLAEASNAEISAWAHDIGLPDRGRALAGVDGAILASTTPEELKAQLNLQPRQWNDFIQSLEAAKDSGVTIVNRTPTSGTNKLDPQSLELASAPVIARWMNDIGVPTAARARLAGMNGETLSRMSSAELKNTLRLNPFSLRGFEKHLAAARKNGLPSIPTKPFVDANAREIARWANDIGLPDHILAGIDGMTLLKASPAEMKTLALDAEARGNFERSFEAAKQSGIPVVPGRFDEGWMAFKPMILITPPQVAQWTKEIGVPPSARMKLAGMDGAALANASPEDLMEQMELSPLSKKTFESHLEAAKNNGVPVAGSKPLKYATQDEVTDWANDGGFESPNEDGEAMFTSPDIVQQLDMTPADRSSFKKSLEAAKLVGIPVQSDGTKPFTEATAAEIARWAHATGLPGASRLNLAGADGEALDAASPQDLANQLDLDGEQAKTFNRQLEAAKIHGLPFVASKPFVTASASDIAHWAGDIGLSDADLARLEGADGITLSSATPEELKEQLSLTPSQWKAFEKSLGAAKREGIPGDGKGQKPIPLAKATPAEVAHWANVVGLPAAARLKLGGVDGAALSRMKPQQLDLTGSAAQSFEDNLATAKKVGLSPTNTKPLTEASSAEIARWADDIGLPEHARNSLDGVDGPRLKSATASELRDELKLDAHEQQSFEKSVEAAKKSGIVGLSFLPPGRKPLHEATPAELMAWAESVGIPASVRSQMLGADGDTLSHIEPGDLRFPNLEDQAKFDKCLAAAKLQGISGDAKAAAPVVRGWLKPLSEATSVEVARWANDHDMVASARTPLACLDGATLEKMPIDALNSLLNLDPLPMKTFEKHLAQAKKSGLPPLTVKPLMDASVSEVSRWIDDLGLPQQEFAGIDGAILSQSSPDEQLEFKLDPGTRKNFEKCLETAKKVGIPGGPSRANAALKPLKEATEGDVAQWVTDIGVAPQARARLAVDGPALATFTAVPALGLGKLQTKSFEKQLSIAKQDGIPPGRAAPPERRPPPAAPARKPESSDSSVRPGHKPLALATTAEVARWAAGIPEYARSQLGDGAKLSKASPEELEKALKLGPLAFKSFGAKLDAAKQDGIPITTGVRMKPLAQANTAEIARWLHNSGVPASSRLLLAGANGALLSQTPPERLGSQMQLSSIPMKTFQRNLKAAKEEGVPALDVKPLAAATPAEVSSWANDIGLSDDAHVQLGDGATVAQSNLNGPAKGWLEAAKKDGILSEDKSEQIRSLRPGYKPLEEATAAEVAQWTAGLGLQNCVPGIDGAILSKLPAGQLKEFVRDNSPVLWRRFEEALDTAKLEGIPAGKVAGGGSLGSRIMKPLEQANAAEIADWGSDIGGLPVILKGLDGLALKDYDVKSLDLEPVRKRAFVKKLEAARQFGIPVNNPAHSNKLGPGHKPLEEATSAEVAHWLRNVGMPALEVDGASLAMMTPEKMKGLGLGSLQIRSFQKVLQTAKEEGIPVTAEPVRATRPVKAAPPPPTSPSPRENQPARKAPPVPSPSQDQKGSFGLVKGNKPLKDATAAEVTSWLRGVGVPEQPGLIGVNGATLASMSPDKLRQLGLAPLPLRSFEKKLAIAKTEGIPTGSGRWEPKLRISRGESLPPPPAGKVSKHFKDASTEEVKRWATSVGLPQTALHHLEGLDGSKLAAMSRQDLGKMLNLQPLQWRSFEKHLDLATHEGLMWTARLRPVGAHTKRLSKNGFDVNLRHVELGPNSGILKQLPELDNKELLQWMKMLQLPDRAVNSLTNTFDTGAKLAAAPIEDVKRLANLRPLPWQTLERHLNGARKTGLVFPYHGGRVFPAPEAEQPETVHLRYVESKRENKNNESKASSSNAPKAPVVFKFYTYSVLRDPIANVPKDVQLSAREMHLADDEFVKIFGMDKASFAKLPLWKKNEKKKQLKLF